MCALSQFDFVKKKHLQNRRICSQYLNLLDESELSQLSIIPRCSYFILQLRVHLFIDGAVKDMQRNEESERERVNSPGRRVNILVSSDHGCCCCTYLALEFYPQCQGLYYHSVATRR
jgi:hypothetical protein